jgi:ABC-2 type transport system permease protein
MRTVLAQTRLILRNDLRLLWRDLGRGKWQSLTRSFGLVGFLFVLVNLGCIAIFFALRPTFSLGAETLAWLFFAFLMLGAAMNHAITVLFERADFDLLLASPVSPRAILLARLAAMTCGAALSAAFFLVPLLNASLLARSWLYASGYLVWLLLAGAVSSAGIWLTLLLVRWLGARRARIWAQVASALLGGSVYLIVQGQNFLPMETRKDFLEKATHVLAHPATSLVARAGRGELLPLGALALVALTFAALTARLLGKMFIGGVQETGGIVSPKKAREGVYAFAAGTRRVTFFKDLRLIRRDPLLLAQVLPTAIYVLPLFAGFYRHGGVALAGPFALVVAAQFSGALSLVATAGEECWDLIQMSPTAERDLRIAKMAAAMALPLAVCAAICMAVAVLGRPGLALLALVFSTVAAAGCSWLHVTRIRPTPRRDVLKRGGTYSIGLARGIATALLMLLGAGGLGLASTGHWAAAALALGALSLGVIACFVFVNIESVQTQHLTELSSSPASG